MRSVLNGSTGRRVRSLAVMGGVLVAAQIGLAGSASAQEVQVSDVTIPAGETRTITFTTENDAQVNIYAVGFADSPGKPVITWDEDTNCVLPEGFFCWAKDKKFEIQMYVPKERPVGDTFVLHARSEGVHSADTGVITVGPPLES